MTADTSIDTFINIYNFSKSAWEPLIEPWQLSFHVSYDFQGVYLINYSNAINRCGGAKIRTDSTLTYFHERC